MPCSGMSIDFYATPECLDGTAKVGSRVTVTCADCATAMTGTVVKHPGDPNSLVVRTVQHERPVPPPLPADKHVPAEVYNPPPDLAAILAKMPGISK